YGNTSAASVPMALCQAIDEGRVQPGDRLVLVAFGAGLTWAAAALEWGIPLPAKALPFPRRLLFALRFAWAAVRSNALRWARRLLDLLGHDGWRGTLRQAILRGWRRLRAGSTGGAERAGGSST
ncbi:MAG: hypothetical protein GX605_01125, partial [Chloroflexi bacterium]|nr:hypothetical protein [Chloroflexota bacterium]